MPPFCAPSPPYLLSEPTPEETEQHEADGRARMLALLVDALRAAEASVNEQNNDHATLADQTYTSLCYDFPIVTTSGLDALNSSLRSSLAERGKPSYAITSKFVAGLRYLVSVEFGKQQRSVGRSEEEGAIAENDVPVEEIEARCHHLLTLCGSVFLLAPAVRLAVAHKDEGVSLNDFLASYYSCTTDLQELETVPEYVSILDDGANTEAFLRPVEVDHESPVSRESAELDDDDSDWEPLDADTCDVQVVSMEELASTSEREKPGWSYLMGKVSNLASLTPIEVTRAQVWDELQLTKYLLQALSGLSMLDKKEDGIDVITIAKLYTELLSDHLLSGLSSSTSGSDLASVISALLKLVEATRDSKGKTASTAIKSSSKTFWDMLLLNTLSKLCTKVGGFPISKSSSYNSHTSGKSKSGSGSKGSNGNASRASSDFLRSLWQSAVLTLPFLQVQFDEAIRIADTTLQVELVLSVLCFLVKYAPGNADLRSMLLEGGFFRITLNLFLKVGAQPHMEVLRHFLLLSMATCPAAAEYAGQVSSFRAAIESPPFVEGSLTRPHAVIWPLLLRTTSTQSVKPASAKGVTDNGAEYPLVTALSSIVKYVTDGGWVHRSSEFLREIAELHYLLLLLAEVTTASLSYSFILWSKGSPVDIALCECQLAVGAVQKQDTQSRSFITAKAEISDKKRDRLEEISEDLSTDGAHLSRDDDGDGKQEKSPQQVATSEAELVASKLKDILPRILLLLKQLSSLTKGTRGEKID